MTPADIPGTPLDNAGDSDPDDLDGHTIEELSDYLDRGRTPPDESIDGSPSCQIALASLARLRDVSQTLLEQDALREPHRDDSWVARILSSITLEARAGRDIPIQHPSPSARLAITEGAARGVIRAAGDAVGGILIGRCHLDGDVTVAGEPIAIRIDASAIWGAPLPETVPKVREAIYQSLRKHTELVVSTIDITIHDLVVPPANTTGDE